MPNNVNCLQYATRGNNVVTVFDNTWNQVGWLNYLAESPNNPTVKHWSSLSLAVKKLVLASRNWPVPVDGVLVVQSKIDLKDSGVNLLRHLASNDALNWTKASGKVPDKNGCIVMGNFNNGGGVHYFVRRDDEWKGVPGPTDAIPQTVAVNGTRFTQNITGGSKSGAILGWFCMA